MICLFYAPWTWGGCITKDKFYDATKNVPWSTPSSKSSHNVFILFFRLVKAFRLAKNWNLPYVSSRSVHFEWRSVKAVHKHVVLGLQCRCYYILGRKTELKIRADSVAMSIFVVRHIDLETSCCIRMAKIHADESDTAKSGMSSSQRHSSKSIEVFTVTHYGQVLCYTLPVVVLSLQPWLIRSTEHHWKDILQSGWPWRRWTQYRW